MGIWADDNSIYRLVQPDFILVSHIIDILFSI